MAAILTLFSLSAILAAWHAPARGQCIDYGDYLHCVGSVDTPGLAYGVAVLGTHAYVADGSSGLQVIDISEPTSPQIVRIFGVRENEAGEKHGRDITLLRQDLETGTPVAT